jgi:hypothetical protein
VLLSERYYKTERLIDVRGTNDRRVIKVIDSSQSCFIYYHARTHERTVLNITPPRISKQPLIAYCNKYYIKNQNINYGL